MAPKKSFLITLRIVFVLSSLYLLRDAFYKWDGFSYHMRFINLLPDLSLVFILWSIINGIIAAFLWLIIYGLFRLIPKSFIPIRLEHIMAFFALFLIPLFIKRTFFSSTFSLTNILGLTRPLLFTIGILFMAIFILIASRYADKILHSLDERITPLVWLFLILLILAVPFSIFISRYPKEEDASVSSKQTNFQGGEHPNIILIVMDTLTARDMQLYGYERPTTPFISEWAKDATVFTRAYASSNWTVPSMMSLMTSQRLWTHGIWHLIHYRPIIGRYADNLPAILKDYGYDVYCFVQNPFAHPDTLSIKEPFLLKDKSETFYKPATWWWDVLKNLYLTNPIVSEWIFEMNPIARKINSFRPETAVTMVSPDIVYNRFLKSISDRQSYSNKPQRPFFAWLHVFPPHEPYLPPQPFIGIFGDTEKFNTLRKQEEIGTGREYKIEEQPDIDLLRKRYDEFILYSDKQFERFMSRLAKTIDLSNTIIILTSDHGESFSHGWLAHKAPHLYESLTHIPLIIKIPGKTINKTIDILVEHTDIAPTILNLAGIPKPAWMEGRTLAPLLEGKSINSQPIFSMQFNNSRMIGNYPITKGTIAVWEGDYKLVYYLEENKKLLFNLRVDSEETIELSQKAPEITQRLAKLIEDELSRANERRKKAHS